MAPDQEPRSFEKREAEDRAAADRAEQQSPSDRRAARLSLEEIDRALRDEHVSQR